jgi:hypothetical protein
VPPDSARSRSIAGSNASYAEARSILRSRGLRFRQIAKVDDPAAFGRREQFCIGFAWHDIRNLEPLRAKARIIADTDQVQAEFGRKPEFAARVDGTVVPDCAGWNDDGLAGSTTLTRTLALLRRRRWLRSEKATDRRELPLYLTAAGQREYKRVLPYWQSAQRRLRQALGEENWSEVMNAAVRAAAIVRNPEQWSSDGRRYLVLINTKRKADKLPAARCKVQSSSASSGRQRGVRAPDTSEKAPSCASG